MFNFSNIAKLQSAKRILVAYSGGLDSSVLLHHLQQQFNQAIIAIHINHSLSEHAQQWQRHCAEFCQQFDIKFLTKTINLPDNSGESLEALARDARYSIFAELMQKGDVLVTGHHQDDQAETLLLQLCRGAGIKGLAAMPVEKAFAAGFLLRPLLDYSREQLVAYAQQNNLTYITDESNFDTNFDRNFLRHEIVPKLKQKWSAVNKTLARTAKHAAETQTLLDQLAAQDLVQSQVDINQLDITALTTLSVVRQKNVLRYWISRQQQPLPSEVVLQQVLQACHAAEDAQPKIIWQNTNIRRYQQKLYLLKIEAEVDTNKIIPWQQQHDISNLNFDLLTGHLTLRYRQGGERFHPHNRDKSQSLKKLMQEWQIPTWQRDQVPLLYCDESLVAVVGHAVAKGYQHAT